MKIINFVFYACFWLEMSGSRMWFGALTLTLPTKKYTNAFIAVIEKENTLCYDRV